MNFINEFGGIMQNVDMMGYCYEREKLGSVKTNYLIKIAAVGVITLLAVVAFYGNQETIVKNPTISCEDGVQIKIASVTSISKFKSNGKTYVRFKTNISGNREFVLTLKQYREIFGKNKKAKCRVHTVTLTSNFGDLRVLKSSWGKIQESKDYSNLSKSDFIHNDLATGDKYTVDFGVPKSALGIYFNIPVTSKLTATTYSFTDLSTGAISTDQSDVLSLRVRMHGKNSNVEAVLSGFKK